MPIIPALGRLKQRRVAFKVILSHKKFKTKSGFHELLLLQYVEEDNDNNNQINK